MCEIGKLIEVTDVEPLSLPASLRREKERPTAHPATVEVIVQEVTVELVAVERL